MPLIIGWLKLPTMLVFNWLVEALPTLLALLPELPCNAGSSWLCGREKNPKP